jgi:hypothetical protein
MFAFKLLVTFRVKTFALIIYLGLVITRVFQIKFGKKLMLELLYEHMLVIFLDCRAIFGHYNLSEIKQCIIVSTGLNVCAITKLS